jgi:DNA-binding response OmpR family regulator
MNYKTQKTSTILLIENDDETRRLLIENLRDRGYRVIPTFDEQNVLELLLSGDRIDIDLVLMNQVQLSREKCIATLSRIYREANFSDRIPSVILAEHYQNALEGTEEKISDSQYILYLENAEQLFTLIDRLCFN